MYKRQKQELLRYMQQNFASFGLLCFARQWSNTLKCGEIYDMDFVANFTAVTTMKRIVKIDQHLSNL